jgi:hypothetical protein
MAWNSACQAIRPTLAISSSPPTNLFLIGDIALVGGRPPTHFG